MKIDAIERVVVSFASPPDLDLQYLMRLCQSPSQLVPMDIWSEGSTLD